MRTLYSAFIYKLYVHFEIVILSAYHLHVNYDLGHQEASHGRRDLCRVIFISRTFCSRRLFPPELQVWSERLEEMDCIIGYTVQ